MSSHTTTSDRGRVLIVDDNRKIIDLLVDLLEIEGYQVSTASDGAEAIDLAISFGPNIVVSDVVMPVVGGLELCRRLKEDPRTAHVPVLLISGLIASDEAGIEGLHAGADDYLDLPFRNEELLVKVARLIERHRIGKALMESEDRYRRLVERSPDAIVVHRNGNFIYVNPAAVQLWGASTAEDLIGKSILDVVHPDYHDHVRERVEYIEQFQRATALAEQKCLRLDGTEIDVEVTGLPFTSEGKPAVLAVFRDVTEKKQAREALRKAEKRLRELFENANDIIYTHDLEGNFTSLNRSGERITGYSREEASLMNVADVIAPEYVSLARDMISQKESDGVSTVYEIDIISKQGRRVRLEVSTRLIFSDGKPVGVQGIARDLTERKHSEEVMRRSQAFVAQQAQREAMTHRISQAIRCSLDSSEIYQTAVRELGSHLDVDRCSLFMKDDRAKCATNAAEYHAVGVKPAASDFALTHLQSLIKALDKTGVWAFDDAANDPRITDLYENILSKANVKSIMYVAIRVGDDVPAAFALSTTKQQRQWSESDIGLAKAVADQTGIAIRQAQLYQKAESTSIREALVNRLTMAIRASLSLPEVLSTATFELGRTLDVSRVQLCLYDSEGVNEPLEYEHLGPGVRSVKNR